MCGGPIGDKPSMSRKEQAGKREGMKMVFKQCRVLPWGRRVALFCRVPGPLSRSSQRSGFCFAQRSGGYYETGDESREVRCGFGGSTFKVPFEKKTMCKDR